MAGNKIISTFFRCIDCSYFGSHGAFCDIQHKQVVCFDKACVFHQSEGRLKTLSLSYFWPCFGDYRDEIKARGMEW